MEDLGEPTSEAREMVDLSLLSLSLSFPLYDEVGRALLKAARRGQLPNVGL